MTGYTVHTGSTVKFSQGWDNIFGQTAAQGSKSKSRGKKRAAATSKKQRAAKTRKKAR